MRRTLLVAAVALVGALGIVLAVRPPLLGDTPLGTADSSPLAATVTFTPAVGAADVAPAEPASVTVVNGTLRDVVLRDDAGNTVEGALNGGETAWTSSATLRYGKTYTWSGSVLDGDGAATPLQGGFATKAPAKKVRATLNIGDDRTVGVAAPIRVQFNAHIEDRAAAERALDVQTSTPVEGSWGWLPDEGGGSRVDWRPKEYWPSGTSVTVTAKLADVDYGRGSVGVADLTSTFKIGRSQIVKADVNSHRMIVLRDGKQVADYPASYGLGSDPERNTRSGIHVVTEKFTDKRMVSERYGYDLVEKWAVRISNNGEFIHANPASTAAQGSSNVTHGCVNLSIENAKAYYDTALYGDPVEVTGTPVKLAPRDGDIWDWTVPWSEWKRLSALD